MFGPAFIPPQPEPSRSMFRTEEEYQRALQDYGRYEARRVEFCKDQEALAIFFVVGMLAAMALFLGLVFYSAGGVKLIAQAACVIGLVVIALVHAYRFIRARV